MTKIRKIDCHYLVYCDNKPVLFTPDKNKANALVHLIENKNKSAMHKAINGPEERLKEIGVNLFEKTKLLGGGDINDTLKTRNKVIIEWHDFKRERGVSEEAAWIRVAKSHNLYHVFKTMDEYNQWALDIVEFYNIQR